jgi:hypothetical protein
VSAFSVLLLTELQDRWTYSERDMIGTEVLELEVRFGEVQTEARKSTLIGNAKI